MKPHKKVQIKKIQNLNQPKNRSQQMILRTKLKFRMDLLKLNPPKNRSQITKLKNRSKMTKLKNQLKPN
jgi:hypothetical protein